MEHDELSEEPTYATVMGSLKQVFLLCLGQVDFISDFSTGEKHSHTYVLWLVFVMASFGLVTHMLNMLIGIMGDSRSKYREIETQMIFKNKLKFVINNWYLKAIGDDKEKINYLVAAIFSEEDEEGIEVIKQV
jgi:hypothetical protein